MKNFQNYFNFETSENKSNKQSYIYKNSNNTVKKVPRSSSLF